MKRYFLKLYQYNHWSNKRVLRCLNAQNVSHEKILSVMGHVLAGEYLWLHRIEGLPPAQVKLWGAYTLEQLNSMSEEIGKRWLDFINDTEDFDRDLTYRNYTNDPYTTNVEMIMIHLVNHSSYHRGQVAMLLRQNGFDPINTDFITYDRVLTDQLPESYTG